MCLELFIFREFYLLIWSQMWSHIINIHSSELLCTKTKEYKINEHKKIYKIKDNLYFLPNNILTRLFKELKIK